MPLAIFQFKLPGPRPSRRGVSVCRGARPTCRHAAGRCTPWRACTFRRGRSPVYSSPSMRSLHGPVAQKSSWGLHDRSPIKLLLPLPKVFAPPCLALPRFCLLVLGLVCNLSQLGSTSIWRAVPAHQSWIFRSLPLRDARGPGCWQWVCMYPRV